MASINDHPSYICLYATPDNYYEQPPPPILHYIRPYTTQNYISMEKNAWIQLETSIGHADERGLHSTGTTV